MFNQTASLTVEVVKHIAVAQGADTTPNYMTATWAS